MVDRVAQSRLTASIQQIWVGIQTKAIPNVETDIWVATSVAVRNQLVLEHADQYDWLISTPEVPCIRIVFTRWKVSLPRYRASGGYEMIFVVKSV
jgi:hypothetical protein